MRELTTASFLITSASLSAQELERRLGLKPDDVWRLGDRRGTFSVQETVHGFILESKSSSHSSIEDHISAMLRRLEPFAEKIAALGDQVKVRLHCELHRKSSPSLYLERDAIRWLGVMGARLDIDVMILGDSSSGAPAAKEEKPAAGS